MWVDVFRVMFPFVLIKLFNMGKDRTLFLEKDSLVVRRMVYMRDAVVLSYLVSTVFPSWFSVEFPAFGKTFPLSLFLIPGLLLLTYILALLQYRIEKEEASLR